MSEDGKIKKLSSVTMPCMVVLQQCLQNGVQKSHLTDQDKSMQFWLTSPLRYSYFLSAISYAAGCTLCLLL
jgi:hypothetical protein